MNVAIAIAAYRPDVEHFRAQLASIVAQSMGQWSCFVTLDSPLEELRASKELRPFFDDARFVWSENERRLGHRGNFERAIELAASTGATAIATADQDDVWYPDKLAVLVARLERCPPLSLVHSDMHVLEGERTTSESVWRRTRQRAGNATPADLLVANVVTGCSMLFDAELARRYGRIPEAFGFHDHWFALAASCHGGVYPVDQQLLAYRQHGGNVVGAHAFEWGVTPPSSSSGILQEIAAARQRWTALRARTSAAVDAGLPIPRAVVGRYRDGVGLGVALFVRGIARTFSDPRFSRAAIRLAVGRIAELLSRRPINNGTP